MSRLVGWVQVPLGRRSVRVERSMVSVRPGISMSLTTKVVPFVVLFDDEVGVRVGWCDEGAEPDTDFDHGLGLLLTGIQARLATATAQ